MAIQDLKDQIARLPEQPGVYLWAQRRRRDDLRRQGARRCATACAAIWAPTALSPRHDALLEEIAPLEVIVTDSVMEALALENNLIKQRTPKYNILLRDDKNYPYLQLTTSEAFPRVLVARQRREGRRLLRRARSCRPSSRGGRWRCRTGCSASGRATR